MTEEVLLFNQTNSEFALALSEYLKRFPHKKVISIAPQAVGWHTFQNVVVVRFGEGVFK